MYDGIYKDTWSDRYLAGTVGSDGTFQTALGPVPQGFCWYLERTTCWTDGSSLTNALLELYVQPGSSAPTDGSRRGRQDLAAGSTVANGVSDNASPVHLGPGMFLVASWSGLASGDHVQLSIQIRVHELYATAASAGRSGGFVGSEQLDPKVGSLIVPADERAAI